MYQYSHTSTPKGKADACVNCEFSFNQSDSATELRSIESVETPDSRKKGAESSSLNCTNLDTVDISIDVSTSGISATRADKSFEKETKTSTLEENRNQKANCDKNTEKEKQQEEIKDNLEETVPTAGGLQVPVITSPADIYKHFPRRVTFQDESRESFRETDTSSSEEIDSRKNVSDSDDQFSDKEKEPVSPRTQETGTSCPGDTVYKMFSRDASEEVGAELLHSYQQTLNNLAQKMLVKDVRIDKFHGRDNEDVSRWFEKLELLLSTKGIDKTGPLAVAQIINNLSGPAETFLFELPAEERESFEGLKGALMKRYSTKDRTWVKRQRLITRR